MTLHSNIVLSGLQQKDINPLGAPKEIVDISFSKQYSGQKLDSYDRYNLQPFQS